jgi:integrase
MGKLTAVGVRNAAAGRHVDGKGLHLEVRPSGAKSWVLRVQYDKKRRDVGLGSIDDLTLAEAREKAAHLRKLARQGLDPVVERDRVKQVIPTFAEAVKKAHAELSKGWAEKTGIAFLASMAEHAEPALGKHRVSDITTEQVIASLSKIWTEKPQQARKVRLRIMQVLGYAKAMGWRTAPLPDARDFRQGLAKQPKGRNFAAMAYADVPDFVASQLTLGDTPARHALLFAILTAARSGEVRQARWDQINREAKTWTRPPEVMKSAKGHVITLSPGALAVLDRAAKLSAGKELVFPSMRGRMLSDMGLSSIMRSADRAETVHGFRSSFRDWAAERMPMVPAMVAEMALAHSVGNATEQAYLRTDLREMRFRLMDAWGLHVWPV